MRFTLFGEAEGVLAVASSPVWVAVAKGRVVDASVSARVHGISEGMTATAAVALVPQLQLHAWSRESDTELQQIWAQLWAVSPWLETVDNKAFLLQIPAFAPPLREVRRLLAGLNQSLSTEQRMRVGLAENPFLARALVEWSRVERVRGARYYKVGRQQWLLSPALSSWPQTGTPPLRFGQWIGGMPTESLWFIHEAARESLQKLGVQRLGEIAKVPVAQLVQYFGKPALLWREALVQQPGGTVQSNYPRVRKQAMWQADAGEGAEPGEVENLVGRLTQAVVALLERDQLGALKIGLLAEGEKGRKSFEKVARQTLSTFDALQAALLPGASALDVGALTRVEVYVEDLRPLGSVQTAWEIRNGALTAGRLQADNAVERLLRQVNRKFPKGLQTGLCPTFRELRLREILQ